MEIIKFTYDNNEISFQPEAGKNLMVNATEMAKAFGKDVESFTRNETTKNFITACLKKDNSPFFENLNNGKSRFISDGKTENSRFISDSKSYKNSFLGVEKEEDLLISKQKSGTWMHRILALKFAAWLNADFEVWVYSIIDDLIFERYKRLEESLKASAKRKALIDNLKEKLAENTDFQKLERLELEERQAAYRRVRENSMQLELFKTEVE